MKFQKPALLFLVLLVNLSFSQNLELSLLTVPDSLSKNSNSVVRSNRMKIELLSSKKMTVSQDRIVTILNKMGNDESNLIVHYDKNSRISSIKAVFYDALGNEIKKISKSKFKDYAAADGISLHNDGRLMHYEYIPVSYPYTVHFKYEIETSNTAFIPKWLPVNSYYQGVQESTFTITNAEGIELKSVEKLLEEFNVSKEQSKNSYEYKLVGHKPSKYEEYSPSFLDIFPSVKFASNKFHLEGYDGSANNWNEFGKWMYTNLLYNRGDLPESTKTHVKNLVKDIEDPIDKARKIYEFVQNKTRYISVQVGIGGWMPMLSSEVDKLGYGDCKALTYYTKSLMDAAGVESYYTAVHAGSEKRNIEKDLISVQGNHVFLYIPSPDKDYWLECTDQKVPFGFQGNFTDDRDVLIISEEGSKIVHTPTYKEENSLQFTNTQYAISQDGHIEASVEIRSSGLQYNNHYELENKSKKDLDEYYKDHYWSYLNNLDIKNIKFENNKETIVFTEKLDISAQNYVSNSGNRMLVKINPFNRYTSTIKRYRNRSFPLYISRGFLDKDEYLVTLPEGYSLEAVPEDISIENKFGKYTVKIEQLEANKLKYLRSLLIKKGTHPKEDYDNFRKFKKQIAKYDNSKFILIKS